MALVTMKELLERAKSNYRGIGAFSVGNMEMVKGAIKAAEELDTPIILQIAEVRLDHSPLHLMGPMMLEAARNAKVDVAVHLDHGLKFETIKKALEYGFTSVMLDASRDSFEENIEKTKEIVELCHSKGVSVEAEVGSIGGEEDGVVGKGEVADPKECKMIADLGVDFLAAGIGNIHGKYPENWEGLDFDALDAIQKETGKLPLVLHGGTGIPEDMIKKAITLGVSKINVNTECQLYFQEATRKYIEAGKDLEGKGFDPRKLLAPGAAAIQECVKEKMEIFGCIGKA